LTATCSDFGSDASSGSLDIQLPREADNGNYVPPQSTANYTIIGQFPQGSSAACPEMLSFTTEDTEGTEKQQKYFHRKGRKGRKGKQEVLGFNNGKKKKEMEPRMNRVIEVPRPKAGSHAKK
jgi:hypothetical protein